MDGKRVELLIRVQRNRMSVGPAVVPTHTVLDTCTYGQRRAYDWVKRR